MAEEKQVEFKKEVDVDVLERAISNVFNFSETEKHQMLLVVWKGDFSGRCALLSMNQSVGWVGQFDILVGYLKGTMKQNVNDSALLLQLDEVILPAVCEPGTRPPMLLVVWNKGDSVLFLCHWLNMKNEFVRSSQTYALYRHIEDLCRYTRNQGWAQIDYQMAMKNAQLSQKEKQRRRGIIVPG